MLLFSMEFFAKKILKFENILVYFISLRNKLRDFSTKFFVQIKREILIKWPSFVLENEQSFAISFVV